MKSNIINKAFNFVEKINKHDLKNLIKLMSTDHTLIVFDNNPEKGKNIMKNAWKSYFDICPNYMIYISQYAIKNDTVSFLGRTTGSHRKISRIDEFEETLIFTATIKNNRISKWQLLNDTPDNRKSVNLEEKYII